MNWYVYIAMLAQCIFFYIVGYIAGKKHIDPDAGLSEQARIELKKYYWDHPCGGRSAWGADKED